MMKEFWCIKEHISRPPRTQHRHGDHDKNHRREIRYGFNDLLPGFACGLFDGSSQGIACMHIIHTSSEEITR